MSLIYKVIGKEKTANTTGWKWLYCRTLA